MKLPIVAFTLGILTIGCNQSGPESVDLRTASNAGSTSDVLAGIEAYLSDSNSLSEDSRRDIQEVIDLIKLDADDEMQTEMMSSENSDWWASELD